MDALNMPLEMIAVCSPDGELSPARFRLETESGERVTVWTRGGKAISRAVWSPENGGKYIRVQI